MSDTKYLELAKKIKALADQGKSGEKENAEAMLLKIMQEHNISKEELQSNTKEWVLFVVRGGKYNMKLFFQVASSVISLSTYKQSKLKKSNIWLEVTKLEQMEIQSKYEFYRQALADEMDTFFMGFVYNNRIFNPNAEGGKKDITPEEREKLIRALRMTNGMKDLQFVKQIKG